MKMTRLEWLADRGETLEAEVSNHESEARMHAHMAERLRKQLAATVEQYYAECQIANADPNYYENATNQVAVSMFKLNDISTAIVADIRSAR